MNHGDVLATDGSLDPARRALLDAVFDAILPASADGRMPAARTLGLLPRFADLPESVLSVLFRELDALDDAAVAVHGRPFAALDVPAQDGLLATLRDEHPALLARTAMQLVTFYYEHDDVLRALGRDARTPFPQGHEVHPGDLSLLDPVRNRGQLWRDVPRDGDGSG